MCVCSGDSLQSEAEWIVSFGSASPHSCLLTHENAQEDSGTSIFCVLCRLRPDRPPDLHGKGCVCVSVCAKLIELDEMRLDYL